VSINEEGTNFELDEKALEEIFQKVQEDLILVWVGYPPSVC
jgi:hypothetical protein